MSNCPYCHFYDFSSFMSTIAWFLSIISIMSIYGIYVNFCQLCRLLSIFVNCVDFPRLCRFLSVVDFCRLLWLLSIIVKFSWENPSTYRKSHCGEKAIESEKVYCCISNTVTILKFRMPWQGTILEITPVPTWEQHQRRQNPILPSRNRVSITFPIRASYLHQLCQKKKVNHSLHSLRLILSVNLNNRPIIEKIEFLLRQTIITRMKNRKIQWKKSKQVRKIDDIDNIDKINQFELYVENRPTK